MSAIQTLLLNKIRLSAYFWFFFVLFITLSYVIPGYKYDPGALAIFSVNSFLYGFYITPILNAQKARIDELHRIIRAEANALFSFVLKLKKLPDDMHHKLQGMVTDYVNAKLRSQKPNGGEHEYEALITYCVDTEAKDHEHIDKLLEALVANQQNRTNFSMQVANKVYANEWQIMAILFTITLGFIITLKTEDSFILHIVRALICTGLTMLVLILIKLSSLTHKRAKQMWLPLKKLVDTNFYRID